MNAGAPFLPLLGVSVPVLGTRFIETPEISGVRSIIQTMLFAIFFISALFGHGKGHRMDDRNDIGIL